MPTADKTDPEPESVKEIFGISITTWLRISQILMAWVVIASTLATVVFYLHKNTQAGRHLDKLFQKRGGGTNKSKSKSKTSSSSSQ